MIGLEEGPYQLSRVAWEGYRLLERQFDGVVAQLTITRKYRLALGNRSEGYHAALTREELTGCRPNFVAAQGFEEGLTPVIS